MWLFLICYIDCILLHVLDIHSHRIVNNYHVNWCIYEYVCFNVLHMNCWDLRLNSWDSESCNASVAVSFVSIVLFSQNSLNCCLVVWLPYLMWCFDVWSQTLVLFIEFLNNTEPLVDLFIFLVACWSYVRWVIVK